MFTKVQFIGIALCTTPANLNSIAETSDDGYYAGLPNDTEDLTARLCIVKASIRSALLSSKIDMSKETLKIFVFPEFFMRGVLGAYYNEVPQYAETFLADHFKNVLNELNESDFKIGDDYLFVLGTILCSKNYIDYKKEPNISTYKTGDHLLDLYYRIFPRNMTNGNAITETSSVGINSLLKIADERYAADSAIFSCNCIENDTDIESYSDILRKTLDYCDSVASLEIENRCVIISGSAAMSNERDNSINSEFEPIIVQKKYKSKEDFILNYSNSDAVVPFEKYLQTTTKYPDIDTSKGENKKYPADGLAIFEYGGLKVGIDICLDHSRQRLVNHLYKNPDDYLDLQIVTSCGMSVRSNAVIAKEGGIVFNCDGEYELKDNNMGIDGNCCHTSLQKVMKSIIVEDNEVKTPAVLSSAYSEAICIPCSISAKMPLYRFSEYQLHVYESLNLK